MRRPRGHLGDSHNFGRRVRLAGGRLHKPRPLLWEWLLLAGDESPLRRLLDRAARGDGLDSEAFGFLPTLAFRRPRARNGGEVESISLEPLPARLSASARRALSRTTGRALALFSWLGISDLHWENLALGVDRERRVVLAPLDVETILDPFALPTLTKLLPDADPEHVTMNRHAAGVRRVLPYLGKPIRAEDLVAMAGGYLRTLDFLDRHARAVAEVFWQLPELRRTPIRVILRGTGEYVRALSVPPWPPLLDAEREQLVRGDIPYFFRLVGERGIRYHGDRALRTTKLIPRTGDVPKLAPLLSLSRGLRAPSRRSLRDRGIFALLAAFDHATFSGVHAHDGLLVRFGRRELVVTVDGREELRARRSLRDVTPSVYLPCRCGEVRTVLVPPVTVCQAR